MAYPSRFGIVAQGQDDQAYHHLFYGVVEKAIAAVICACPKNTSLPIPSLAALRSAVLRIYRGGLQLILGRYNG